MPLSSVSESHTPNVPLWAITSFYNPAGYKRRLINFRNFRKYLSVPLVVVELSFDGTYEIGFDEADRVIRLSGNAMLWQKERLLNIALENVPRDVANIAWLDSDIIFQNPIWASQAAILLKDYPIIQLFSELYDLDVDVMPEQTHLHPTIASGNGIVSLVQSGMSTEDAFRPKSTVHMRRGAFGLAWAAQRSLIETYGFYDAMILGSGDRAMACAAYGRFDDTIQALHLNSARTTHYLAWANRYHAAVQGNVGYLPGAIYHLWHGDLANRGYKERHVALGVQDFDPTIDLELADNKTWRWARRRPEIEDLIQTYFKSRLEDGI